MLRGEARTSQTVVQGKAAMLDCAVGGDPVPSLRWHKDGQPLLGSLRFHPLRNGSLALYSATVRISYAGQQYFVKVCTISKQPITASCSDRKVCVQVY